MSLGYYLIRLLKGCLILTFVLVQVSLAQGSGVIKGRIYDKNSKDGLPGANLIVRGTSIGTATDLNGRFTLRDVPLGSQILIASYIIQHDETTTF